MHQLTVNTQSSSYTIYIDSSCDIYQEIHQYIKNKQVVVVTNTTIEKILLDNFVTKLNTNASVHTIILEDGEQYKNAVSMNTIYDQLLQKNISRDSVIIALGGGVIGDMTGFAAATYQRGVDFIQVPTTLLSQVDSSVGGKTGINHELGKNMIGAFKQPKVVLINTETLKTLPKREVSAGIAEIIKYALINDYDFFCWLEENMDQLYALDDEVVAEAIFRSCEHKANIVSKDEFESGVRALLNLGHTFGHVIENYMGYGRILHGEAVAIGMLQAAYLSMKEDWICSDKVIRIKNLLLKAKLPVTPPDIPVKDALKLMARDKKVQSGNVRLVLLKDIGNAFITDKFNQDLLEETLITKNLA